jgi:hypothetical protein
MTPDPTLCVLFVCIGVLAVAILGMVVGDYGGDDDGEYFQ